jgi:hypothetical protein
MQLAAKAQLFPKWSAAIITSMIISLSGTITGVSHAEDVNISNRRNSERTSFTNDEIRDGFFKIAFDAELQLIQQQSEVKWIRAVSGPLIGLKTAGPLRGRFNSEDLTIRVPTENLSIQITVDFIRPNAGDGFGHSSLCTSHGRMSVSGSQCRTPFPKSPP